LQDEARKALESALGHKKTDFEKWDPQIERKQQRGGPGGPAAGGRGWSGGGRWFRWFTSGGFWDAAKQTILTILGIIAAVMTELLGFSFQVPIYNVGLTICSIYLVVFPYCKF
jgi:hypothetical protein